MGKNLKESLAAIRARALGLRFRREAPELLDALENAGAITRGVAERKKRRPESTGKRDASGEVWPERGGSPDPVLERYKTGEPGPIETVEPGEVRSIDGEPFYLVRSAGEAIDDHAVREAALFGGVRAWPRYVDAVGHGSGPGGRSHALPDFDNGSICFLDIETTGLSPTTYLFLIGLMYYENGAFVVEQVFARDYSEESAVLRYVRETLSRFGFVVTYNGARFDLPFIETRMAVTRVPGFEPFGSVDLLYTARKLFSRTLPNCRLGTVERHIRGIGRTGDIPGAHIPHAYHDYVRTGDARAMKNVLYHNRMDLFTMAILLNRCNESGV